MKKAVQKILVLVLTAVMIIGLTSIKGQAAVTDKRSNISGYKLGSYPTFPKLKLKQQYFVIYTESYRKNRIEVCFFDILNKADLMHVMWQGKKKSIDIKYGKLANDEKYYLDTTNKKWVKFEEGWGSISTGATTVRHSNLDIYNASGNKEVKKTVIKYLYFEDTSVKMDKGDVFTLKAKTNLGKLKFTSSNKNIVAINTSGKIRALKKGTVTITAKASNGKTATCKVTVK